MTALVTGATGLVGGALVRRLTEEGLPCRAMVRDPAKAARLPRAVEVRVADLTRPQTLPAALEGVETIYHCAGKVDVWGEAAEFFAVNGEGVRALLEAARRSGVRRIVHLSAGAVHGRDLGGLVREDCPFTRDPHPYIRSKIEGERLVAAAGADGRLQTVILRPVHLVGPGARIVRETAARIRSGKRTLVAFPPGGRLPVTGLDNLVDALRAAGRPEAPAGRAWFINDGEAVDWNRFVRALADVFGLPLHPRPIPHRAALALGWWTEAVWRLARPGARPPLCRYAVAMLDVRGGFSIERARTELGWTPRRSLRDSLVAARDAEL